MENEYIPELEEMREQLGLLKEKLSKEEIVNERLLRETIRNKADYINRQIWITVIAAAATVLCVFVALRPMNFSMDFCLGTTALMAACVIYTWRMHRNVTPSTMNKDLLTVAKIMRKLKQDYQEWLKFGIPAALLWFTWFSYEIYRTSQDIKMALPMIIGGLIGGAVGGFVGNRQNKKVMRICDEIVKSIEGE